MKVISYGGGVQSTALLVLAATGRLDVDAALFANVGDDSEHPDTIAYVRDVAVPWATGRGVPVHELHRYRRDGSVETLHGRVTDPASTGAFPIPLRGSRTGAPGNRTCTADFKIRVIGRWLRDHGATPTNPTTVMIGFSTDEIQRVGGKKVAAYERVVYPLLDLGLDRSRCMTLIAAAGLPVPPKSACWFCPFHRLAVWSDMARDRPDLFADAAAMEAGVNRKRAANGRDPVYLTVLGQPLDVAITAAQDVLPFDETDGSCETGYCFT